MTSNVMENKRTRYCDIEREISLIFTKQYKNPWNSSRKANRSFDIKIRVNSMDFSDCHCIFDTRDWRICEISEIVLFQEFPKLQIDWICINFHHRIALCDGISAVGIQSVTCDWRFARCDVDKLLMFNSWNFRWENGKIVIWKFNLKLSNLTGFLSHPLEESRRTIKVALDAVSIGSQFFGHFIWPLTLNISGNLWFLPLSIFFISFRYWENFVAKSSSFGEWIIFLCCKFFLI